MTLLPRLRTHLFRYCTVALLVSSAVAQDRPNVDREKMWWAPTAEDWRKPCLITWQRTWEDALAVSRETNRPILVCVNMDGEIASEHYAGIRYRMPEIAKLYEPYVTVIASVYRHTPRDYDEQGNRVICPRFGTVTCGEHIAIEPILYEKYFDGERVAPRHVMIELDGEETYDVYYAWDTDSVFKAIEDGIANRTDQPPIVVRGDRPVLERVNSHDSRDRDAVEEAYREGDEELRRALLEAAREHNEVASVDLLRLGVFGLDVDMARLARQALARSRSDAAVDLIPEALSVPMEESERKELLAALDRIGDQGSSRRARWLSVVHRGLGTRSTAVNVDGWSKALVGAHYPAPDDEVADWMQLESRLEGTTEAAGSEPRDGAAQLEHAEAALRFALEASQALDSSPRTEQLLTADPTTARTIARSKFHEALTAARKARELGEIGWRTDAVVALATYYLGDTEQAYALAETAAKAIPAGATEWSAMAVLTVFAEGRFKAIKRAVAADEKWPPQWLTDVDSAYTVLLHHPEGTDAQAVWHHDFLRWLGARRKAARFLDQALHRFAASPILHDRLRARILEDRGADALEPTYARMLEEEDASPDLEWYAGLASFMAAEYHRRAGDLDKGRESYSNCIHHFDRAIAANPELAETSDPYVALALGGQARIAFEQEEYELAVDELLASFKRKEEAAATLDGLNLSPVDTAKMVRARLLEMDEKQLAARLQAALDQLDPRLLELPAYEGRVRRGRDQGRPQ